MKANMRAKKRMALLRGLATKAQVERLALATKTQFREMAQATQDQIDELALSTANEFQAIRNEMKGFVTKQEFHEVTGEILRAIDRMDSHIGAKQSDWHDRFDDHETRINNLERRPRFS